MLSNKEVAILVAVTAGVVSFLPALADDNASTASGADTQSTPPAAQTAHRGHKHAQGALPKHFKIINQLSSITDDQKQQIDAVISTYKQETKPLREQARAMKLQARNQSDDSSSGGAGSQSATSARAGDKDVAADSQDQLKDLHKQLHQKTHEAMKKILSILTPDQRQELKELHARNSAKPADSDSGSKNDPAQQS